MFTTLKKKWEKLSAGNIKVHGNNHREDIKTRSLDVYLAKFDKKKSTIYDGQMMIMHLDVGGP